MQLFVLTLDDSEEFIRTLSELKDHGMNGVVMQSTSLKHALFTSNVDAVPIFGSLGAIMKHDYEASHTLFILIPDEKVEEAKEAVHRINKDLKKKGIMFSMPVSFWEGIE